MVGRNRDIGWGGNATNEGEGVQSTAELGRKLGVVRVVAVPPTRELDPLQDEVLRVPGSPPTPATLMQGLLAAIKSH